ncbi:TonB-dependent receptor domain-containing protein [Xanthomonas oryzae]|uniref:TonB-dependent receptor domain-containing protein n=1 Tax=Xanthomonas oryzae TaxID=347 RepID=UPI003CCFED00
MEQAWSYDDSALDVALYDRVDVVRGATGLLTGSGNPQVSINLVRKHAVSRDFTGTVSVGGGDVNKTRRVADVTVPLSPEGTVRAHAVGVYQDGESDMERYSLRKKIGSAIVDADLTDSTLLSVGYECQKKESNDVTWGGLPLFYSDGTRTDYKRSFNPAADWTFWDTRLQRTQAEGRLCGRTFLAGRSADAAGGARYTDWQIDGGNFDAAQGLLPFSDNQKEITPYAGLLYDIDDVWSTYVSYTEIFNPQTLRDANGGYLDPLSGKGYEAGVKAEWFDDQFNASLALFRIEQDNLGVATGGFVPGSNESAYQAANGVVSEGFDFELSGRLIQGWNATFGASHYTVRDDSGTSINAQLPRTTIKLFSSYTPQGAWSDLAVGRGVNWQNRSYYVDPVYGTFQQSAYARVSAFARYRLSPQFSVQLNVDHLLDKRYYAQFNGGYGA